jgi:hypothetical protein
VKKKIFKNVILFGGGRWAKIYLETLIQKKVNIVVITSNKKLINFFLNQNFHNYKIINKLDEINLIKKIIRFKKDILLEKPLSNDPNDFFKHNLNKKNIYLSLQFTFANYFIQIKKKIKNEIIENLSIDWFDKKNEKKTFNNKIHFIEDIYYHFFSIIRIFIKNQNIIKDNSIVKMNKIESILNKTTITLNASKNKSKKIRILTIQTNKNKFIINFKNLNSITVKKNKNPTIKIVKNVKNLPIQINNFLLKNNNIKQNSLKNLKYLFEDLIKIKKKLPKN